MWKGTCTDPRNFSLYLSIHSLLFSAEPENNKKQNKNMLVSVNFPIISGVEVSNPNFISAALKPTVSFDFQQIRPEQLAYV